MIIKFRRPPVCSVAVYRLQKGHWRGRYDGDEWTEPFITEVGPQWLVLDALKPYGCIGLPIVVIPHRRRVAQ